MPSDFGFNEFVVRAQHRFPKELNGDGFNLGIGEDFAADEFVGIETAQAEFFEKAGGGRFATTHAAGESKDHFECA